MDELRSNQDCTLPSAERPSRLAELDTLITSSARDVRHEAPAWRVHLAGVHGPRERVEDLAAREAACCPIFTFVVEGEDSDLDVGVSVPPEHESSLAAMAARAAEMAA